MENINPKLIIKPIYLKKKLTVSNNKKTKKIKKKLLVKNTKKISIKENTNGESKIKLNIIRDDLLPAGTKQRAMVPYLKNKKETEFVYVSPFTGGAQITLAYATVKTAKHVTLFINKVRPRHPLTLKALKLGDKNKFKLIEVNYGNFKKLRKLCADYIKKVEKEKGNGYIKEIHLGFDEKEYNDLFIKQLKLALPEKLKKKNPKRLWVPCGSTTILKALYEVLPKTHFIAVQTGKTIWPDQIISKRTTLLKSREQFYEKAKEQPPYPTTQSYDAKMWVFIKEIAQDNDYVWNVTSDDIQRLGSYSEFTNKDYNFEYCKINYSLGTNPYLECLRNQKWNKILNESVNYLKKKKIYLKSGNKPLKEIIGNNFAMWISINILDKNDLPDPFFPYNADKNEILINTFMYLGNMNLTKAKQIFKDLDLVNKCNQAIEEITQNKFTKYHPLIRKGNNYIYMNKDNNINKSVKCNLDLYKRLRNRFKRPIRELNDKIFCLLLRYETLMGNAHQFAMNPEFKNALRNKYNIDFECFASSINVHYKNYCSLFYDIERDFGSFGNFYLIKYKRGFYIANPPYEEKLLELMVKKFIKSCQESKEPLSFSFGLPNWNKYGVFKAMEIVKKSNLTKFVRCMKDREVKWFDRLKNVMIRIPSHCRCVIQNKEGEKEHNLGEFNDLINKHWVS